jgi:hypothetical protein
MHANFANKPREGLAHIGREREERERARERERERERRERRERERVDNKGGACQTTTVFWGGAKILIFVK